LTPEFIEEAVMLRMSSLALLIALTAAAGSPPDALAQAPKKGPDKDKGKVGPITAEERQFLLYSIENLSLQLPEELSLPSAKPGRAVVELFTAIYRSAKEGRPMRLP